MFRPTDGSDLKSCCQPKHFPSAALATPKREGGSRVWLPRNPLYLNDAQTVLLTRLDDPRNLRASHTAFCQQR